MASAGGIESQNVVGYNETALRGNSEAKGVGACFLPVNGGNMKLGDIKIVGYGDEYADFAIAAQTLDGSGHGTASYKWCDFKEEGETYFGWYDDDMNDFNGVELAPGEGLWVFSPSEDFKVQCAGAVADSDVAVALRGNSEAKMVVNPMPKTLTLGDVKVAGYGDEYADFAIAAQTLDGSGHGTASYKWCDFKEEGETYFGWYDDDMNDFNDVELAPGEGLWIFSPSEDYSVVFPSPLVKD